jgi:DNA repair exonuclease SbcCD ATPase subunit
MRFGELEIQNFLSFGPKQVIELGGQGLVVVLGQNRDGAAADSNGAGKSTIMEAIVWVLFGETMRGYKADEVVHRLVKDTCYVSLTVMDDQGSWWKIERTRSGKAKRANDLKMLFDGKDLKAAGINVDTQEMIYTLLGMDKDTFVQSVLMCYGTKPFSELADSAQKEVLEKILQIDTYRRARDIVTDRVKKGQTELASVNTELASIDAQLTGVTNRMNGLQNDSDSHAQGVNQRRVDLLKRKAETEAKIEEQYHSAGLDRMLDTMKDMEAALAAYRTADDKFTQKIIIATRLAGNKRTELYQRKGVLEQSKQQYDTDCNTFNEMVGKPCPTCKRVLEFGEAEELIGVWDDQIKNIDLQLTKVTTLIGEVDNLERNTLKQLQADQQLLRNQIANVQAQQRLLHTSIQQRAAALHLIVQLEQQSFNLNEEIEKLDEEVNPYTHLLEQAKAEQAVLTGRRQRLSYKKRALDLTVQHLLFWDQGFGNSGIKSFVIEGVLPFLDDAAQRYADIMSGGDLQIEFSATKLLKSGEWREEFQVVVRNRQGADVYKGNSDGEKRRVNTCVGWAIGDLAAARAKKSIRFRGLDEPFENLDETGEDSVIKLLHTVLPEYETIFCITHSDHMKNQFPKVLSVVKEGGFSRVEA